MTYHNPVLLNESIEGLNIQPKGVYVDLTFGGGGHSREVLNKLGRKGRLIAFDQDPDAEGNIPADDRLTFVRANFRFLKHFLRYHGAQKVDGILADLGISSHQIDIPERGFSFRAGGRLDMRMNSRSELDAARVISQYSSEDLTRLFRDYGELSNARQLAAALVQGRMQAPVNTVTDLEKVLSRFIPPKHPHSFLAKVYQALRIEVNQEMAALSEMLLQTGDALKPGGRLVVITYHSLEDRLVKNFLKTGNLEGKLEKDFYGNPLTPWILVNRNVIVPGAEELERNNRARSAKLRIAEKKDEQGKAKY